MGSDYRIICTTPEEGTVSLTLNDFPYELVDVLVTHIRNKGRVEAHGRNYPVTSVVVEERDMGWRSIYAWSIYA